MSEAMGPLAGSERYEALDLLRGVAVLGILIMNIQAFAMPFAAYFNPTALGEPAARDFTIWSINHLLADQKFMTIFSLLFGAGVLFMARRIAERRGRPALVHYRRMFWLLLFGLFHAYLMWYGDILVLYAICGALIYPARHLRAGTRLALGILVLAVGSGISVLGGLTMPSWPPEQIQQIRDFWQPPAAALAREIAAFQGGWLTQLPVRAEYSFEFHTNHLWFWGVWRAGGLMLIGMALLDWRVLTGQRSKGFFVKLAALALAGVTLTAIGLVRNHAAGWPLETFFLGGQWNYWGSVLTSLGWIGVVMLVWQAGAVAGLVRRLVAVGRMAFTSYILQTVLATAVFYGHGLGLFGRVDRLGQMGVVVAIWVVLLLLAPWWLSRYRMGPLEWLWRTLTYGTAGPLRRAEPVGAGRL